MKDRPMKSCAACGCQVCICNKQNEIINESSGYAGTVAIEQLFAENQQLKKRVEELELNLILLKQAKKKRK